MLATLLALALALTPVVCSQEHGQDFTGRWSLVEQETSAWRGRSATGAHEEAVVVTQTPERLTVRYDPGDGTWDFEYALAPTAGSSRVGEVWAVATWEGAVLFTRGRRRFRTPKGGESYDFEERRSLSADGARMTVVTRIEMFPKDLIRTAVYERTR